MGRVERRVEVGLLRHLENRVLHSSDGDNEENNAKTDGDCSHNLDEVMDLDIERALILHSVEGGGGDVAEEGAVAGGVNDNLAAALGEKRAIEGQVFGLKRAFVSAFGHTAQRLWLASERAVVDLRRETSHGGCTGGSAAAG